MSAEIESLVTDGAARRVGGRTSPMLVVIAVLALLLAVYAHVRVGRALDGLASVDARIVELDAMRVQLASQQRALAERLQGGVDSLRAELQTLRELPEQVDELSRAQAELLARTEAPQRAWVRAEALYLLELAGRRLDLESDVRTAIVAMEAADARLATLKDPALANVRAQLAKELAALRAVPLPDLSAVLLRVGAVEARVALLPVTGIPVSEGRRAETPAAEGPFGRAWRRVTAALKDLFSLRRVDQVTARLVTQEEESLRRQHLELLLAAARIAAMQSDAAGYSQALSSADQWLEQYFEARSPAVAAAREEIGLLRKMTVQSPHPSIGTAAQLLRRVTPSASGPSSRP
jgi:uroporphyrin-3 C-methyltransferase